MLEIVTTVIIVGAIVLYIGHGAWKAWNEPLEDWMLRASGSCVDGRHSMCAVTISNFVSRFPCECPCHTEH